MPSDAFLASMTEQADPGLPIRRGDKGVEPMLPPHFVLGAMSPDPLFGTTDRYKRAIPLIRPEDLRDSFPES